MTAFLIFCVIAATVLKSMGDDWRRRHDRPLPYWSTQGGRLWIR